MILKAARVQNFKCVRNSGSFRIDDHVTCLVGKNESGKTALLQAIYKLNPVDSTDGKFEDIEYPRALWSEYQEKEDAQVASALDTTWQLEPDDRAALEELLGPIAQSLPHHVVIEKGYDNVRRYALEIDESAVVAHIIQNRDFTAQEKKHFSQPKTIKALKERLAAIQPQSQQESELSQYLQKTFPQDTSVQAAKSVLDSRLPKFVYFSEYMRLPGEMAIEDFKANCKNSKHDGYQGYRMFEALLGLVGKTPQELEKLDRFEPLQAELEAVSARISKSIFKYWSQNRHLLVRFLFSFARSGDPVPFNSGWIMRTRIENTRHASTTSFDERSTGFVWFFSFLVWFGQMQKNYGKNLVVLLDEPGLTLHARAQADLLRYMEAELAPKCQVIYTTHSPFMIDPANLLRARTVEDVTERGPDGEDVLIGTRVGDDVLSTDRDTVFPLQACLGYEITQSLFVGKHTLLVEGPSDILYLKWFQRQLARRGRTALDQRWTVAPCNGIDKVAAFMSLFRGNNLQVAVLADFKKGDKTKISKLSDSRILPDRHILTVDTYAAQSEADIEDLVGRELYTAIVNAAYGLNGTSALTPTSISDGVEMRVVALVESAFRKMPPGVAAFDHYRPAEFLFQEPIATERPGLTAAIDRFERLFVDLNALLPAANVFTQPPKNTLAPITVGLAPIPLADNDRPRVVSPA